MSTETTTIPRSNPDPAPSDFTEFFQRYYGYVKGLVQNFGIEPQNVEDVAMNVLVKFYEKDALSHYSPDYTTNHGGVSRPAKFTTFLSGFVLSYVRHYRNRQAIQARREGTPIFDAEGESVYVPTYVERYDDLTLTDLARSILQRLESSEISPLALIDPKALYVRIIEQSENLGRVDVAGLSREFGISEPSIRRWVRRFRDDLNSVLENQA